MFQVVFSLFSAVVSCLSDIKTPTQKTYYKIVVSFNSICCGVPSDSLLRNKIKLFRFQYGLKKIKVHKLYPFGKEGEYKLGFQLQELTPKQKTEFVTVLKKTIPLMMDKGYAVLEEDISICEKELPEGLLKKEILY